jgi:Rrf2 family protein
MMCLSQTTGYAIQALGCMNDPSAPTRQIADIAKCSGVPKSYLAKIIGSLTQKGLIFTKRGFRGGISLARPPQEISLLEIVEAVEGEHWLGECMLGFTDCKKHFYCPTQAFWTRFKSEITAALRQTNLAEVLAVKAAKPAQLARSAKLLREKLPEALAPGKLIKLPQPKQPAARVAV